MSLKAIHIVFVTCATLLAFGFGAWELNHYYSTTRSISDMALGVFSFGGGIGLICYGKYFLKKLKNIGYL